MRKLLILISLLSVVVSSAFAADYPEVAKEIKQDLNQAISESTSTKQDLAQKKADLQKKIALFKSPTGFGTASIGKSQNRSFRNK